MIDKVKGSLRVTSNDSIILDEIEGIIQSAKLDLKQSGVKKVDEDDPLIIRAIILYAKANYGLDGPNADRFDDSYKSLKIHLSQAGDYLELE